MAEIGLFPLELVLLPGERVPLHIFEGRYRELIGECREHDGEFGLVLEDESGTREIGTRTAVVELLHTFEDGRMNVLVEGRGRFRILAETGGHSYRTAEAEPVEDVDAEPPTPEQVERALTVFRRLAEAAEAGDVEEPDTERPGLSFALAARVELGNERKQELLELRSERERLERLTVLLDRAVEAVALEREVRRRASGNGKVTRE